jgi:hypothetical protein
MLKKAGAITFLICAQLIEPSAFAAGGGGRKGSHTDLQIQESTRDAAADAAAASRRAGGSVRSIDSRLMREFYTRQFVQRLLPDEKLNLMHLIQKFSAVRDIISAVDMVSSFENQEALSGTREYLNRQFDVNYSNRVEFLRFLSSGKIAISAIESIVSLENGEAIAVQMTPINEMQTFIFSLKGPYLHDFDRAYEAKLNEYHKQN